MHGYYGLGFGAAAPGFPWVHLVLWILGLAVFLAVSFFVIRAAQNGQKRAGVSRVAAFERLAERLAAGEISKEEYLEVRSLLAEEKR